MHSRQVSLSFPALSGGAGLEAEYPCLYYIYIKHLVFQCMESLLRLTAAAHPDSLT